MTELIYESSNRQRGEVPDEWEDGRRTTDAAFAKDEGKKRGE